MFVYIGEYREEILRAIEQQDVEGIDTARVTILNGKVAVHPRAELHHLCVSCYPGMAQLFNQHRFANLHQWTEPEEP